MAGKSVTVTTKISRKKLQSVVAREMQPGFRDAGKVLVREVRSELKSMNATEGGGGAGPAGTLARSVTAYKKGIKGAGIRVGAKKGTPAAAALIRITGGFVGRDRKGRLYSQAPRPVFGPAMDRARSAVVRAVSGG